MIAGEQASGHGAPSPGQSPGSDNRDNVANQAQRFLVVGLGATAAHFLVLAAAVHIFGVARLTIATIVGTCVGIIVSYVGHHRFTYSVVGGHVPRFSLFLVVYGMVMTLHAGLMYWLGDQLGLAYAIPFVVATAISAAITFVLTRQIVFRRSA